ncbi:MAG TPA: ATP-binding cassette domain-containing protein, partial [Geminicoccaceae bacterium]|nr:ATP-binding cassette domain-containing protein [Geminicoccaceae bacterium]
MFLELREVAKRFGEVVAVDGVSLAVAEGEFVCFLGPSGCGKTTLLRLIAGLEIADAGEIRLGGRDLAPVPARLRNFGVVFQSYSLFPNMTVAKNVAYGLECRRWPAARLRARVEAMLALVHLADQAAKYPAQLSGGQQQRVALARALAPEPPVLLLDEPLSALDAKVREELRGEIRDLQRELGITTVMVTHDQDEAMEMADRIVVMNRGRIAQVGTAFELYTLPANRFVAEFIGRMNVLRLTANGEGRPCLCGQPLALDGDAPLRAALIGVRPEDVLLGERAGDAGIHVRGVVEKAVFLGNVT